MDRRKKHESYWTPQDSCRLKINVYSRQKVLPLSKASVRKALEALCSFFSVSCDEISVYFVEEKKICQLHKDFFNDPSPTDCITFPIDDSYLGDIFVCPEAAIKYSPKHPYQETLLYVIHGLLHLLKYDDLDPVSKDKMRKMEKKGMDHLNKQRLEILPK